MLATPRTVRGGTLRAFEYLRIVERDGGLVYVAQPNGAKPTEFVLTELGDKRAVFLNPRHDSPRRIVYEVTAGGGLLATVGQLVGGTPQRFELQREGGWAGGRASPGARESAACEAVQDRAYDLSGSSGVASCRDGRGSPPRLRARDSEAVRNSQPTRHGSGATRVREAAVPILSPRLRAPTRC
jgi:hypothetical protein